VATSSRLLKIRGLFRKRALQKRRCFVKETYNFKEPTNRSQPIMQKSELDNIVGTQRMHKQCVAVCCSHCCERFHDISLLCMS